MLFGKFCVGALCEAVSCGMMLLIIGRIDIDKALRIKSDNIDFVRAERDHAKEPEPIGRGAADRPYRLNCSHRLKSRIGLCDGLQGFELLQLLKDHVPGRRENRIKGSWLLPQLSVGNKSVYFFSHPFGMGNE